MGKLFYIMGKSASGKDSFMEHLKSDPTLNLKTITLYTTRPIRDGEEDGREYHFITDEEAISLEKSGKVIECRAYHTVHGLWKYMTVEDDLIDFRMNNYIAIGTLESFLPLRQYFGEDIVKPIYVEVEDGERLLRAIQREKTQKMPKYAEVCRRFLADEEDFQKEKLENAGIKRHFCNDKFERCLQEIYDYIKSEK